MDEFKSVKNVTGSKTVTIDMYEPYVRLFRDLFPNAAIIFDRSHIVQHLNRELNKYRVQVMNTVIKKDLIIQFLRITGKSY